jgi:hypothetical protein
MSLPGELESGSSERKRYRPRRLQPLTGSRLCGPTSGLPTLELSREALMWSWLRRALRPPPADRAEALIDFFIEAAKEVGAESPREAAERTNGVPLNDEEWARYAASWCRRWY